MPDPVTPGGIRAVPGVDSAERLDLHPGDVIVFRVGDPDSEHYRLTDHEYGTATARIRATLGDGARFVLLDGDMRLDRVLAQEAAEQLAARGTGGMRS